jgi:hypothetical protein
MVITAALFLGVSVLFGVSVNTIWRSLKLIPQLQRNHKIVWLYFIFIFLYSFSQIPAAVIFGLAFREIYQLDVLLFVIYVDGIFKAAANFFGNLTLLFLINRLVTYIQTEQQSNRTIKEDEDESVI